MKSAQDMILEHIIQKEKFIVARKIKFGHGEATAFSVYNQEEVR